MLEKREFEKNDFVWRLSTTLTLASGFFSLIVFILLLVNYLQIRAADPINDPLITQMRLDYAAAPARDEALAQRIRDLDLMQRKAFFTSQDHLRIGGTLLLIGVCVFLFSFKNMTRWKPDIPELSDTPAAEVEWLSYADSRQMITWAGVTLLAGGLLASFMTESALKITPVEAEQVARTASAEGTVVAKAEAAPRRDFPKWEALEVNWPAFRGPGATGMAHYTNAPTAWDLEAGTGVRWKVKVPRPGTNSPVVWGDRVFVSGADENVREVYCYDTETGDLVWTRRLEPFDGTPAQSPAVNEETGYAASTMVAHGAQVFAIFVNGDIVSYDFSGNLVWGYNLGSLDNHYGHSSSLLASEGLLYVQLDSSSDPKLLALDITDGHRAWAKERESISWASPILAHTPAGAQLILNNEENVDAYDPLSGKLLWTQECLSGEVAPSPAYRDGVVFVANEFAVATAIQLDGSSDGVQPKVLWEWDEYLPEVSSPVGDGERWYIATSAGELVSIDAKTGEEVWVQEYDDGFYSSPVLVADRIYIADMGGNMHVVRAGAEKETIATIAMGEQIFATPAFMDGRIYVRTLDHLYCIEN